MKNTGIIRRIDDLGRIVIPKEIRNNLKIREGEKLEIFLEEEKIILSKYSSMKSIDKIAKICVDALCEVININILITDRDKIIAASPNLRKKYLDKELDIRFSEKLLNFNTIIEKEAKLLKIITDFEEETSYISIPILIDGDIIGNVIILNFKDKINETDELLGKIISKFLIRNIF